MDETSRNLKVVQFPHTCPERAGLRPIAALLKLAGTRAVPCRGLVLGSLVNGTNVVAARIAPITVGQAQYVWRDVVPRVRVDHRRGHQ